MKFLALVVVGMLSLLPCPATAQATSAPAPNNNVVNQANGTAVSNQKTVSPQARESRFVNGHRKLSDQEMSESTGQFGMVAVLAAAYTALNAATEIYERIHAGHGHSTEVHYHLGPGFPGIEVHHYPTSSH